MSVFFRTLRSAYNKAIDAKCAKKAAYPFNDFKVSKFNVKTKKRAIPKQSIKQIMELDLSRESEYMQLSRDLFIFSYLCGGINFTDMANLKYSNINEDKLVYIRQKTHKEVFIPLCPDASVIIDKYKNTAHSTVYIFPILNEKVHISETQKYNRKKKVLLNVNDCLKTISEKIGSKVILTTYVARHSFATVLKKSGVSTEMISETLGHSDIATTQIYLDSFENEQIGEAFKNLL
jgi:site-specific recombinase XerD